MAGFSSQVVAAFLLALPIVLAGSPKTCSNPQTSCKNTTAVSDLCCFNAPGGQLVQTQFWDTSPSTGPSNSWTIHGLWPDHCDGTYDSNCDASRAYTNITAILQSYGKTDLLSYMVSTNFSEQYCLFSFYGELFTPLMLCLTSRLLTTHYLISQLYPSEAILIRDSEVQNTYWVDINGDDESFWEHEWAKHGTCISTLKPSCYTDYTPQEEIPDFFQKTVDLFKTLDSYTVSLPAFDKYIFLIPLLGTCKRRHRPLQLSDIHFCSNQSSTEKCIRLRCNNPMRIWCVR